MLIVEIAFCFGVFSVNPSFGRISMRALVDSLSLETIIPSGSVSQEVNIKLFVENISTDDLFNVNKSFYTTDFFWPENGFSPSLKLPLKYYSSYYFYVLCRYILGAN